MRWSIGLVLAILAAGCFGDVPVKTSPDPVDEPGETTEPDEVAPDKEKDPKVASSTPSDPPEALEFPEREAIIPRDGLENGRLAVSDHGDEMFCLLHEDRVHCNHAMDTGFFPPLRAPPENPFRMMDMQEPIACALHANASVQCWGTQNPFQGWLGDRDVAHVAVGAHAICLLHTNGSVACVGDLEAPGIEKASFVDMGEESACALVGRNVVCWGGLIGNHTASGEVRALAVGDAHACVLVENAVDCWGEDDFGQAQDVRSNVPIASLAAGGSSSCIVLVDATIHCWGAIKDTSPPGHRGRPADPIVAFDVSLFSYCAHYDDGSVWCSFQWHSPRSLLPGRYYGGRGAVTSIHTGDGPTGSVSCVTMEGAPPYCWGSGPYDDVWDLTTADRLVWNGHGFCAVVGERIECRHGDFEPDAAVHDLVLFDNNTLCVWLEGDRVPCWDQEGAMVSEHTGSGIVDIERATDLCILRSSGVMECIDPWSGEQSRSHNGIVSIGGDEGLCLVDGTGRLSCECRALGESWYMSVMCGPAGERELLPLAEGMRTVEGGPSYWCGFTEQHAVRCGNITGAEEDVRMEAAQAIRTGSEHACGLHDGQVDCWARDPDETPFPEALDYFE